MIHYFDTGAGGPSACLGRWLDTELVHGIKSFHGQFGFFSGSAVRGYLPVLEGMLASGGDLRIVIGANSTDPPSTADLEALLPLLRYADRGRVSVVGLAGALFHPKTIHLVRQDGGPRAAVSSANFTAAGLGHSVEAGLILEDSPATASALAEIRDAIDRWSQINEPGVHQVRDATDVQRLLDLGLIVTPVQRSLNRQRSRAQGQPTGGRGTRPRGWRPPGTPVTPEPVELEGGTHEEEVAALAAAPIPLADGLEELWQSKPLTRRDLTIPDGAGTNQTGSINLDKGLLPEEVDHRHYFRDEVFDALDWQRRSDTVDEAFARFGLAINGVLHGDFDLPIRHTTSTDSRAYEQRNAMTRLSWGPVRQHVARHELIGRTMTLLRQVDDPTRFVIRIA